MRVLTDLNGRAIRLTVERLAHLLEHADMQGEETRIDETLRAPDSIISSSRDPQVHLFHKLFDISKKMLL